MTILEQLDAAIEAVKEWYGDPEGQRYEWVKGEQNAVRSILSALAAAKEEIARLAANVLSHKCAAKLILGRELNKPWTEIDDELEGYLPIGRFLADGKTVGDYYDSPNPEWILRMRRDGWNDKIRYDPDEARKEL